MDDFDDFGPPIDPLDYWRLCDELSVVQAALLVVGVDPSGRDDGIDDQYPASRPKGYNAAKAALELDPKVRSVASDGMICRRQACGDGEQRCGRRSTVEFIDARATGTRAICRMRSGRGWSR